MAPDLQARLTAAIGADFGLEVPSIARVPEGTKTQNWRVRTSRGEYCAANPDIAIDDVRFAPHVWLCQLVRSEYGLRQHDPAGLDRCWFQRCNAAELILERLDEISKVFVAARGARRARR